MTSSNKTTGSSKVELGDLWLRWYVHKDNNAINLGWEHEPRKDLQQLRVRDIANPDVWKSRGAQDVTQLVGQAAGIEQYMYSFRDFSSVSFNLTCELSPEGFVIVDGSHRSCALYLLGTDVSFDIHVVTGVIPRDLLDGPRHDSLS